jgi:hypothetical protein
MAQEGTKSELTPVDENKSKGNVWTRNLIAISTILLSGIILILLIIFNWSIINCSNDKLDHVKELFALLLPVIGTWVGTVLAFYFTRENFEAANQSIRTLIKQVSSPSEKFKEIKVSEVMISTEIFPLKTVANYDSFTKCTISELVEKMKGDHSERLPILEDKTLKFIFLIYLTTLERFLLGRSEKTIKLKEDGDKELSKLTILDMIESDYQKAKSILELTQKQPLLPITSSLADVRKVMQDNNLCYDVFITKTGDKNEKVEGWITNDIIIEKSELFKKSN